MKRFSLVSGLLLVCICTAVNVAQAQSADQQSQMASGILGLLDRFEAEPVQLSEEQQRLYSDDAFNFTTDPVTTEAVRTLWLQILEDVTGSEVAAIEAEKTFGPDNVQELADQLFGDSGFQVNNYFDVLAMELISNMFMAQDIKEGTTTQGDLQIRDTMISSIGSEEELRHREDTNAEKQQFQQMKALVSLHRIYSFFSARTAGMPTDKWQEEARLMLAEKYQIDTRFMEMTDEGIGLSEDLKDVISGKREFETVYPDLDLAELSKPSTLPVARVVGAVLPTIVKFRKSMEQSNSSSPQPDPAVPAELTVLVEAGADTSGDESNPVTLSPDERSKQKPVNPLAADTSAFAGQFQGDGLSLSLDISNNNATGALEFNGQQFPVEGVVTGSSLNGVFKSGSDEYSFEASAEANQIRFVTGDTAYTLSAE